MYKSQEITIEGTSDLEVARALAYLAGFEEHKIKRRQKSIIVYHRDTVAKDPNLFLATQNPDIIVKKNLGEKYLIEFTERVDESLIPKIEKEIEVAYSKG